MVEWKLNVSMTCHGVLKIAPQVFVRGFFRSLLIRRETHAGLRQHRWPEMVTLGFTHPHRLVRTAWKQPHSHCGKGSSEAIFLPWPARGRDIEFPGDNTMRPTASVPARSNLLQDP
jgi:hypothetical protein